MQLSRKLFQQVIIRSSVQSCKREISNVTQQECLVYLPYFKNWKRLLSLILLHLMLPIQHFRASLTILMFQAPDFYMEMKWEFTSWGKTIFDMDINLELLT